MLQIHTNSIINSYRLFGLQGIIMPAADKAEWLISICLYKAGSSGFLGPDASKRIPE